MWRLGLCCLFVAEPIRFRTVTARTLSRLPRPAQLARLAAIARANDAALQDALAYCASHGIGAFRISSSILPLATHPRVGYAVGDLPDAAGIVTAFRAAGRYARRHGLRLSLHPDPFIVLNSPAPDVIARSVTELVFQAQIAAWVGADVITIHAGGAYGDPRAALARLAATVRQLPPAVRQRLTLENDEHRYGPGDLLPLCHELGIPLVYDVHHHRCRPDGLSIAAASAAALGTWNREPLFHLSSPAAGWQGTNPAPHHDYIAPADVPAAWRGLDLTIEVEAKAKERAIARLQRWLRRQPLTRRRVRTGTQRHNAPPPCPTRAPRRHRPPYAVQETSV